MNWKNLKFKPEQLQDGDWFVKTHIKKGERYGFRYSQDIEIDVVVDDDCLRGTRPKVGDKLAHGIIVEANYERDSCFDYKFKVKQTPEQQAIAKASTLNFNHYHRLAEQALDNMRGDSLGCYDADSRTVESSGSLRNPC